MATDLQMGIGEPQRLTIESNALDPTIRDGGLPRARGTVGVQGKQTSGAMSRGFEP